MTVDAIVVFVFLIQDDWMRLESPHECPWADTCVLDRGKLLQEEEIPFSASLPEVRIRLTTTRSCTEWLLAVVPAACV